MTMYRDDIDEKLNVIRHILLSEDREKIQKIEEIIENTELLGERIDPIIDNKIADIKNDFHSVFGQEVGQEFEKKLALSEDLLLTVISPMMGKMIKRYINGEIQKIKDSIDQKVKRTFSFKRVFTNFRNKIFGIKTSDSLFNEVFRASIQDIIIIQHNSGLVMGKYSTNEDEGDKDIFSGMLTAIIAFGEDAFRKSGGGQQNLGSIEYDNHLIFLHSHHNYYFAVVLKGAISTAEKDELTNHLIEFARREKRLNLKNFTSEDIKSISQKLKEFVIEMINKLK